MSAPLPNAFRFWTEEKLRNADTDQFRHVNNAVIATFFEAARMEIFSPPQIRSLMDGANLAVVRLLIEFRTELHFPGHVGVGSAVIEVGNTSFRVRQSMFDDHDETLCATAEAVCVLVHGETGRPHPIAPELRAYLSKDAEKETYS
ncbi:acyl-CoA thioesterase [Caballeronia sp. EK]|uniref:acyl-CoA thioesterase n=1 Tax=unclassified Caballeronia TaxID=2646786 RepID=UPI001655B862|nr:MULTISPECIES: thioesterase family protein [unclassified Caballeronia]MBC8641347.1 acyl-CoA thioesterase [Caballeronia sp. EK]BCQ28643.1 acyl-CoA thioesterase [Caballeronia sp. NK8]BCQ30189.1 acyl-CoA thioesterase [Caballeronia sp. NK8]